MTVRTIAERAPGISRTQTDGELERLLTSKEVAELLVVTEPTLARWRAEGRGPAWIELGHRVPRYRANDLDAWIRSQRRGDVA